ncbi:MAG: dienelactone hydrolase family protein [Gemmataceae bacterium]
MRTSCWTLVLIGLLAAPALVVAPASAQDPKERLEKSPRHHEWVKVKHGEREVTCFVVYPEVKGKVLAMIVIHENKGLTDWVRGLADQVAEAGYIAVAPDLLSGLGPKGGNTDAFKSVGDATKALYKLDPKQVTGDLNAVADYAKKIPAATGKIACCGFCWGGGQSFRFATNRPDLSAAFVFYGPGVMTKAEAEKVNCPVFGFYGGNDERINATIDTSKNAMKAAGKRYEPVIYEGAGHGFMRAGEEAGASAANRDGRNTAWERWKGLLKDIAK